MVISNGIDCMENKYVKIPRKSQVDIYPDKTYEVTEKLDGANFSFYVKESGELVFRSRNRELLSGLENNKQFKRACEYIRGVHNVKPFECGYIYFGESMAKHTIDYGVVPPFIGFGVLGMITGIYIKEWYMEYLNRGVPFVTHELVMGDELEQYVTDHIRDPSEYGEKHPIREGLVAKNYETQTFVKFVNDEFKEENRKTFKGKLVPEDETGKIVLRFCTVPRIEKQVFKLRDERGIDVGIHMMSEVPRMVSKDIFEEEHMTIFEKYKNIDFKQFKKLIAKECLHYFNRDTCTTGDINGS
jgi:hypothetical protein